MLAAFNMAGESTTATSTVTGSAPENASLLVIEHLRVDFPEVVAVNDLSLRIEAGDVCGLIGPNGAGKTTTMRAVSGLQEFTRGSVRIAGRELAKEPDELKRRLGFMPDFCPTYDQLTTSEFLDHFARAFGVADRARRISECLELTWLTDKRDALCEELSRGMKQRLVLAKTMLPDPQVLLLDEPASGLDPLGRIELRKLLLQLRDAGKAVLMERGRLVKFGTLAELGRQMDRHRMSVKWRAGGERAREILKDPAVAKLEPQDGGVLFDFLGGPDALDELLKTLVTQGVRICEWRGVGDDLEQIFLQSGAKELM